MQGHTIVERQIWKIKDAYLEKETRSWIRTMYVNIGSETVTTRGPEYSKRFLNYNDAHEKIARRKEKLDNGGKAKIRYNLRSHDHVVSVAWPTLASPANSGLPGRRHRHHYLRAFIKTADWRERRKNNVPIEEGAKLKGEERDYYSLIKTVLIKTGPRQNTIKIW